jgi:DNA mismatch repair protein MutS
MMKQFLSLKDKYPDAIMLFRCGDFYETYSTDAVVASDILGITLTKRANGKGKTVEMAGFPYHALDTYLPKLDSLW